jgi:hypothetical protein
MKTATQPKTETTPAAAPVSARLAAQDWANNTPRDFDYDLMMYDEYDGQRQHIALTRDEYIELKQFLAGLRGLIPAVAEPTAEPAAAPVPATPRATTAEEQKTEAAELAAEIITLDLYDLRLMAGAMKAVRIGESETVPAECFIRSILDHYRLDKVTPETARDCLDTFAGDFEWMRTAAREFSAKYDSPATAA